MLDQEFDAQIHNGQLVPSAPLRFSEGQRVHVTVSAPDPTPQPALDGVIEIEPCRDLDIEKDVYACMPFLSNQVVKPSIVQEKGLKPCLIFPEDSADGRVFPLVRDYFGRTT